MTALPLVDEDAALTVNEVYWHTLQGEGPSVGRRCGFIRLGRCNLDCGAGEGATWACDTPYTWDWRGKLGHAHDPQAELHRRSASSLAEEAAANRCPMVVLTGGEPLLQQAGVACLARRLDVAGIDVEVETNGTQAPWEPLAATVAAFNVSPKLANSGVAERLRFRPQALAALRDSGKARFKFVCADPSDLAEVADVCDRAAIPARLVWVMPAGTDAATVGRRLAGLAGPVIDLGWNLTTRLHVELWGDRRGV